MYTKQAADDSRNIRVAFQHEAARHHREQEGEVRLDTASATHSLSKKPAEEEHAAAAAAGVPVTGYLLSRKEGSMPSLLAIFSM